MDPADIAQDQIEKEEAILVRNARLNVGISPFRCYGCGSVIQEKRRLALPGTDRCFECASEKEKEC